MREKILRILILEMAKAEKAANDALDLNKMDIHRYYAGMFHGLRNVRDKIMKL